MCGSWGGGILLCPNRVNGFSQFVGNPKRRLPETVACAQFVIDLRSLHGFVPIIWIIKFPFEIERDVELLIRVPVASGLLIRGRACPFRDDSNAGVVEVNG